MNWQTIIDHSARKQIKKLPKQDTDRIMSAINEMSANPYTGDIRKMEGEEDVWRRRVGNYRIFYEVFSAKEIIHIFDIQRRTSSTY